MAFRLNAIAMNHAIEEMYDTVGLPYTGPRMQVPPIPKGPPIFNNIKVDNSVVGSINTGNVQAIDVNLTYLHSAGNDKARDALKALIEAVVNDTSISDTQKNELVDQITFLSEQTVAGAKERKPGLIKATFNALTEAARTVSSMASAWQAAEPILKSLFG
jgi:hypothetical protein